VSLLLILRGSQGISYHLAFGAKSFFAVE
jgi:hypothetical protein